jgi:membrane protease YdiL (CAAX protease family)
VNGSVAGRRSDLLELWFGYGLILLAIWTPRPWQFWLDWAALAFVVVVTALSFDGWTANGLRERGFVASLWVVGAALAVAIAAVLVAVSLHTLHAPHSVALFVRRYWDYAIWAVFQQFLLLDFFLRRLQRLLLSAWSAVLATAGLFALAHVPNPVLVPVTLVWGAVACALFLRYRNVYTLGMAHAIFGICIAVTVPGQVDHNMRVGLGYLKYQPHLHRHHRNQRPQIVSTVAWVMAEAPTRRC